MRNSKIWIFRNCIWHSRGRWNLINHPTHMSVSSIFLKIWCFKVWAQIFLDQGYSPTTLSKFYFYTFKSDLSRQRWAWVKWSWVASGPIPLAFLKYAKINFTCPSKTLSSFLRSPRYETKRLEALFEILHSPLYKSKDDQFKLKGGQNFFVTDSLTDSLARSRHIEIFFRDNHVPKFQFFFSFPQFLIWMPEKNLERPSENICRKLT